MQLALGLGAVRLSKPTLLEKVGLFNRVSATAPRSIESTLCLLYVHSYWHLRFDESRMLSYSASTTSLSRTFLV